ncbi:MAG: nuclear transport factor 2 family protein [Longimicrobiales bacterium]|nr:nuclear transport factor 2 family protein [Longimicrobiales bacterium]
MLAVPLPPANPRFAMTASRVPPLPGIVLVLALAACAPAPVDPPGEASTAVVDSAAAAAEIRTLLDDFLARAGERSAHERFWAEDLVYTSSRGTRTTKAAILAGMAEGADTATPGPTYRAEDVDVRVYGNTAVVAFRLVIQPPEGSGDPATFNLNTGMLQVRDREWRVVAWQSTVGADPGNG